MTDETNTTVPTAGFDRRRYLRVVRFFAGAVGQFILWEILLRRLLGRRFVTRGREERWQRVAHRFRTMAVDMGGVLIKLGQFLSVRVDVLPRSVTAELSGLQDEVPAERLDDIRAVIEAEYGRPLPEGFDWFAPQPEAAASLAQVHRARLSDALCQEVGGGGEVGDVVVKVQRPRIGTIVETDLRAVQTASGWLKRYGPIRRRVDMDSLYEEFAGTTRRELDFVAEAGNGERFAANFAGDHGVRIPRVYAGPSTRRVLIMENVANIKIGDYEAMEAAGISRQEVARRLFDTYLQMVFRDNFVHADPHPGNLFVQPLPPPSAAGAGDRGGDGRGRPFRLVFVDFGMVAAIPPRLREYLFEFLIGFATRDAGRIVRAYQGAGILRPGADLARLEQVEGELLDRYANLTLREVQRAAMSEWHNLAREYRDILYEMPFQIPVDLLFVGRAMAILFGMATSLDPDFDPWRAVEPFARQVAGEELRPGWRAVLQEVQRLAQLAVSLPGQADRFLRQATQGELTVRAAWTPETTRTLRRVETAISRLAWAVVFAALLLAGVAVYLVQGPGAAAYVLLALAALSLLLTAVRR